MKVLLIEDNHQISELIKDNLEREKFEVEISMTGTEGLIKAKEKLPSIIILDLMLPDVDGLDVCKKLKYDAHTRHIPVLMLTAKRGEMDRIVGLEVGADDYLTKPFSPRELILRLKVIARRLQDRSDAQVSRVQNYGPIYLDSTTYQAKVRDKNIKATFTEFRILQYLLQTRGKVATREMIMDYVWGYDTSVNIRTVDIHITRLREKMGVEGKLIRTVRNVGYCLSESGEVFGGGDSGISK